MQKRKITFLGNKKNSLGGGAEGVFSPDFIDRQLKSVPKQLNHVWEMALVLFGADKSKSVEPLLLFQLGIPIPGNTYHLKKCLYNIFSSFVPHKPYKTFVCSTISKNCFFPVRRHDCDKAILPVPPFVNTKIANGISNVRRIVINKNSVQSLLGTHRQEFLACFCIFF